MTGIDRLRKLANDLGYDAADISLFDMLEQGNETFWGVICKHDSTLREALFAIAKQIEREHAQTVEDHEKQQEIIRDLQRERDEALRDLKKSRESAESSIIQKEVIGTCEVFEELHEGVSCFEELTKVLDEFHRLIEEQGEALRAAAASRRVASELRTLAGAWDEWGLGGKLMSLAERLEAHESAAAHSTEVTTKTYTRDELYERKASCDDNPSEPDATFEGEKVTRDASIAVPVLAVVEEMERHCLGVEGAEDSPVATWARELREVVGWPVRGEEDARAAKWVRERGGIDAVSSAFDRHEFAIKRLYRMAFPGEGKNYEFPTVDDCFTELDRRLMPPGMEWPRFEDGEKVKFGDDISGVRVESVVFRPSDVLMSDCTSVPGWGTWRSYKEPIERQKPAPVGADGVPITNGESVYEIGGDGTRLTVVRTPKSGEYQAIVVKFPDGNETTLDPPRLTHTKPEPPDNYCRLYADMAADLAGRNGNARTPNGISFKEFVRRAKALAERERGE